MSKKEAMILAIPAARQSAIPVTALERSAIVCAFFSNVIMEAIPLTRELANITAPNIISTEITTGKTSIHIFTPFWDTMIKMISTTAAAIRQPNMIGSFPRLLK